VFNLGQNLKVCKTLKVFTKKNLGLNLQGLQNVEGFYQEKFRAKPSRFAKP